MEKKMERLHHKTSTNATKWKRNIHCRQGDIVMTEGSNCKIGWNNVRERGRKEGNPVQRFVSCHILMSPPEDRGSAKLPHNLPSDFRRWRSSVLVCVFSFIAENTLMLMLITQQLLVCFVGGSGFILYYVVFGTSSIDFTFLDWLLWFSFPFPCLACVCSSFLLLLCSTVISSCTQKRT